MSGPLDHVSKRAEMLRQGLGPFWDFLMDPELGKLRQDADVLDLSLGNPMEPALPEVVAALQDHTTPRTPDWFGYMSGHADSQAAVAASLKDWRGLDFSGPDILMTNGAFGAIAASLYGLVDAGEEVVYFSPHWFNYEAMVLNAGAVPVRVDLTPDTFDLDAEALAAAMTPRTRMVVVNSPHNPTGRVFPEDQLRAVVSVLEDASLVQGRPIWLLCDEPYSRLVFDDRPFPSASNLYAHSLIAYSYGKVIMIPGERLGWLALNPAMPEKAAVREALMLGIVNGGFLFPHAVGQRAMGTLEGMSLDIPALQAKRDRLAQALDGNAYRMLVPEGTFYALIRLPTDDDQTFCRDLARKGLILLPGSICAAHGHARISLLATAEQLDHAAQLMNEAV